MDRKRAKKVTATDHAIGTRIRARRLAAGMSQSALSDALGITYQQLQKYEKGINRVSGSRLVEIAGALQCSVEDLLGGSGRVGSDDEWKSDLLALMQTKEGAALARAFLQIKNPKQRDALVKLAEAMANAA